MVYDRSLLSFSSPLQICRNMLPSREQITFLAGAYHSPVCASTESISGPFPPRLPGMPPFAAMERSINHFVFVVSDELTCEASPPPPLRTSKRNIFSVSRMERRDTCSRSFHNLPRTQYTQVPCVIRGENIPG